MDKFKQLQSILGKDLKEHVVLRDYTTMKVGGVADYFYVAKSIDELMQAILTAKKLEIPFEILGGGSNVLISDFGFGGLIILNRASNIAFLSDKAQIIADSGVSLARLIIESANYNLSGLESFYGIPGTLGGAVYGNVGTAEMEICQLLKSITVLSPQGKILKYQAKWLEPEYRLSKLKKMKKALKESPVILSVKLQLAHSKKEDIIRKIAYWKKLRADKQPYDKFSAGSIFKNLPTQNRKKSAKTQKEMSAGYILDKLGAKKMRIGDARVSKKHANFIINNGQAKAADIRNLIDELREKARQEGVTLEEEIEYVGNW